MYCSFRGRRKLWFAAAFVVSTAILVLLIQIPPLGEHPVSGTADNLTARPVIVIDAGHGGPDPGAIGVEHTEEKGINLSIALKLRDMLRVNGYDAVMIREEDVAVNDPGISKIARIKTSDLKNRLQTIDSIPGALAVSIHQNFFEGSAPHGAQMFYGRNNPESQMLAEALQFSFRTRLQPDNPRVIKRSTKDVYIVHNAKNPIVLVECGFLSNPGECANLRNEEYQQKVAFTIFCGISEYRYQGISTSEDSKLAMQ